MSDSVKRVTIKEEPEEIPVSHREDHESAPEAWDTEEVDYLLSHLIDGASIGNPPQNGNLPVFSSALGSPVDMEDEAVDRNQRRVKRGGLQPPSTPAVQFYAGHGRHSAPSAGQPPPSVTEPALTSMAAALVSGGPVLARQVEEQVQSAAFGPTDGQRSTEVGDSQSPISPAAIIGSGHENLMLPPPPKFGAGQVHNQRELEKQQHLAWLQQINAMARMANQQQHQTPMVTAQSPHAPAVGMPLPPHVMRGYPAVPPAMAAALYGGAMPPPTAPKQPESEEKRARRLARNAESARNSRRRKKERLHKLSHKVAKRYGELEVQRREVMASMEPSLQQDWFLDIDILYGHVDSVTVEELQEFLAKHSPNRVLRQAVLSFQFATWKQLLLPRYQEFLMWWTAQPPSFLVAGREHRAKVDALQGSKSSPGRVSSKQIGKEIMQGWENSKSQEDEDEPYALSCAATDALRVWPLLCHELEVGVEQEERLLQMHKTSQDISRLPSDRAQMADASKMVLHMCKGVRYQCHAASMRTDTALVQILTPAQSVRFLRWFARNRDACRKLLNGPRRGKMSMPDPKDASLNDLCRRLDKALRLPASDSLRD